MRGRWSCAAYAPIVLSKITWVCVLLIHGDRDQEVAFQESVGLVRALRAARRVVPEVLVFPDESHGLSVFEHQLQAFEATENFFQRLLRCFLQKVRATGSRESEAAQPVAV